MRLTKDTIRYNQYIFCACGCSTLIPSYDKRNRKVSFVKGHIFKLWKRNPKAKSPNWKGGKIKWGDYWYIYKPNHPLCNKQGYVLEHHLVYEKHFKCHLLPFTVVHHKNGNKEDNRIENLEPMYRDKHLIIHDPLVYRWGCYH